MDDEEKMTAMHALLYFIEAERRLRPLATQFESEHPDLFKDHTDGIAAEMNKATWNHGGDRRTLAPLLKVLRPHKGINKTLDGLPYYPDQYDHVVNLRNSIGHGLWEELEKLGGSDRALKWAQSFYSLVFNCTSPDPIQAMMARAAMQVGNATWPWPEK